jgi:hypothetical protein
MLDEINTQTCGWDTAVIINAADPRREKETVEDEIK